MSVLSATGATGATAAVNGTPRSTPAPTSGRGVLGWKVWVRTLHLWTSLFGLVLLLFFGATGFMLNHADAFGLGQTRSEELEGQVQASLTPLDDLALVEELRAQFAIQGGLVELHDDEAEISLRFSRPGEDTDVIVARPDGAVRITRERGRVRDLLTDLHKGERGGGLGRLLVDAAALLLLTISISGLAMWWAMPRRRKAGVIAFGLAIVLLGAVLAALLR